MDLTGSNNIVFQTTTLWTRPNIWASGLSKAPNPQNTSLIHFKDSTYFVWIDEGGRPQVSQIKDSGVTIDHPVDDQPDYIWQNNSHNTFSLGMDRNGYLHVAGDMHNYGHTATNYIKRYQKQSMLYWKSKHSEDISGGFDFVGREGSSTTMPGNCWTYGRFFCDNNGVLYYSSRVRAIEGGHKPGELGLGLYRYDESNLTWTAIGGVADHLRDGTYYKILVWENGGMAADGWYQGFLSNLTFDKNNHLHLFTGINTNTTIPGNNRALYAKSPDGGATWFRSDGTKIVGLPLRAADGLPNTAEITNKSAVKPYLASRTCIITDKNGNPGYLLDADKWTTWDGQKWNIDNGLNVNRNANKNGVPMFDYAYADNKKYIISLATGNARLLTSISFQDRPTGYDFLQSGFISYLNVDEYALRRTGDIYGVGVAKDRMSVLKTRIVPAPLPDGWMGTDIAIPAAIPLMGGSSGYLGNEFVMTGYGITLDGKFDDFRFTYKQMTGDCTITAQVNCTYLSQHARVGVMIREDLTPYSKSVFIGTAPGEFNALNVYRKETSGNTFKGGMTIPKGPYWVRLSKVGTVYTTYISPDGNTWTKSTTHGSNTITMNNSYYVGLATISSHRYGMVTASFKHVQITS